MSTDPSPPSARPEAPAPQPAAPGTVAEARGEGPSGPRAGFWRRFAAALLDGLVLAIPQIILVIALDTAIAQVLSLIIGLAYYIYLEGSPSGQTVGKRALEIRVIDLGRGGSIGYGRAAIRYLGRIVSSLPLFLGYFWMLWDREKQTWHDKFANSVVVPVSPYPVEKWPG